ncbi:hypothetical protein CIX30_13535 [Salmonella enterica]|nr:hypothetical protein [Salmonella enterica]ECE6540368.1 hypothetical protein [Salmonella enterica subsp. enterica]ECS7525579.1 hypothetical protein [Salmonella enterica]ECU7993387.1 hypothetical protein [Salmonella enterica subsp. enterica serovar Toucra]EJX9799411.1 hypothetical protein [Salmonella enterica]
MIKLQWDKEAYQHRARIFMRIYNKENHMLPFIIKNIINEEYAYAGIKGIQHPERETLRVISNLMKIKEARELESADFIKVYEDVHHQIEREVTSRFISLIFS